MDNGREVTEKRPKQEVVLDISGSEEIVAPNRGGKDTISEDGSCSFTKNLPKVLKNPNPELAELEKQRSRIQISTSLSSPPLELAKTSPTPNKPPKIPLETMNRRISFSRSAFSKPKSRFQEPGYPDDVKLAEDKFPGTTSGSPFRPSSPYMASPGGRNSAPITPRTPLIHSLGDGEEDDEDVYKTANLEVSEHKRRKVKAIVIVEWTAFICIMGMLVSSLTVHRLQKCVIWGLELWKWCVLVLVMFCGRLFSQWFINCLVFLIERNYLLKKKVLYFVYGLKKSVQVFIWIGLVILAWELLFNRGVKRSENTSKILNYVTRALVACPIGAAIWLLKTLLVKLLASSFQCTRFFDRIQESIFHQYVLRTLSGPPLMEMAERIGSTTSGQLSFRNMKKEKEEEIDVDKLKKMEQDKVSAWTMKGLIDVIRGSGLSTISNMIDSVDDEDGEQKDKEITSEWEAKAAAYQIFKNVAKHGSKYIEEEDLLRFMKKEEVDNVLPMFEGAAETGKIKRSTLKNWLVNVYLERKSLAHSLNDTKTAIEELNRLASGLVIVIIIVVWLLLMELATTKVLVFISSQLLLVVFMFGNTAKTLFEAIIFVFGMHPFDVGDRCVVDGVQMVVEEMNILTTVFLRYDGEKIFYPNSVLSTKPISNFYRSPEMSDAVEFAVDVSTTIETIGALKAKIKAYLESKPQHWRPGHSVAVKEIENMNKMKMALYVTHTINFQNYGEKSNRRSELVLELKKIFEELGIKYHLLPQEVQISYIGSAALANANSTR